MSAVAVDTAYTRAFLRYSVPAPINTPFLSLCELKQDAHNADNRGNDGRNGGNSGPAKNMLLLGSIFPLSDQKTDSFSRVIHLGVVCRV